VPVHGCTLPLPYSRAIPLLPLWTVRPVQSLSACTRVHFTFTCDIYLTTLPVRRAVLRRFVRRVVRRWYGDLSVPYEP